jgi:hypothetical protein
MDYIELEEILSKQSIAYVANPGLIAIKELEEHYKVTILNKDQIKIEYVN